MRIFRRSPRVVGEVGGLLGLAALVLPLSAMPAAAAASDPLVAIPTSTFGLHWYPTNPAYVDELVNDPAFPGNGPYGPTTLLDDWNHSMAGCSVTDTYLPTAPRAIECLTWAAGDQETLFWNPQGITTSGDADDDGVWGDRDVILSGWHVRPCGAVETSTCTPIARHNEGRVAFIDYSQPIPKYRWAYLVEPTGGGGFRATKTHMGGMVWYGNLLFVTGQNNGAAFKVFDLQKMVRMSDGRDDIGKSGNARFAYGYEYVIPQVGFYGYEHRDTPCGDGSLGEMAEPLCFSSVSLDRSSSPDSLVTTEYLDGAADRYTRLVRYPLGANFLLRNDGGNVTNAWHAYRTNAGNVQGVASNYATGRWWTASSRGGDHGWLYGHSANGQTGQSSCGGTGGSCWAIRPQGLTRRYAFGQVWSQTEKWNERRIFGVTYGSLP
jgi:hypothetical protein